MLDDATIARLADAIVTRLTAVRGQSVYSTYQLPPDVGSRSRFNTLAKSVPGAVRRGKAWVVSVDAWNQFRDGIQAPKTELELRVDQLYRTTMSAIESKKSGNRQ